MNDVVRLCVTDHIAPRHLFTEVLYMFLHISVGEKASFHATFDDCPDTRKGSAPVTMPFELLRASLAHTLNWWPMLAGRISPDDSGRLSVTQNNAGAVWVEAEASGVSIFDIIPEAHQRQDELPLSWSNDDLPPGLFMASRPSYRVEYGGPALMVQATRLTQCGSVLLAVWMDHAVHDCTSFCRFVNAWAAVSNAMEAHAAQIPPPVPLPVDDRSLIPSFLQRWVARGGRSRDHSRDFLVADPTNEAAQGASEDGGAAAQPPACRGSYVHFTAQHLKALKAALLDAVQRLPESARPPYVSTHDALLSHLWSVMNEARRVQPSEQPILIGQSLSLRDRVEPPLPEGYTGSAFVLCVAAVSGDAACEKDARSAVHFANRAASIRASVEAHNEADFVASLLHATGAVDPPQYRWGLPFGDPRGVLSTSWERFPVYGCDFGWGRPASVVYAIPKELRNAFVTLPSPTGEGVDVWLSQTVDDYERMVSTGRLFDFDYC